MVTITAPSQHCFDCAFRETARSEARDDILAGGEIEHRVDGHGEDHLRVRQALADAPNHVDIGVRVAALIKQEDGSAGARLATSNVRDDLVEHVTKLLRWIERDAFALLEVVAFLQHPMQTLPMRRVPLDKVMLHVEPQGLASPFVDPLGRALGLFQHHKRRARFLLAIVQVETTASESVYKVEPELVSTDILIQRVKVGA